MIIATMSKPPTIFDQIEQVKGMIADQERFIADLKDISVPNDPASQDEIHRQENILTTMERRLQMLETEARMGHV